MNDEEQLIEQWAAAAGWRVDSFTNNNGRRLTGLTPTNLEQVKRFASLVAAHERERAEQESLRYRWLRDVGDETWIPLSNRAKVEGYDIDAFIDSAIRQRGSAD